MNYRELSYIITKLPQSLFSPTKRVQQKLDIDGGDGHPLWTIMNLKFPPELSWRSLKGAEREQVKRAGKMLDAKNIPYSFYADFLERFGKGYLKRMGPFPITKYKQSKDGSFPIFAEYLGMVDFLVSCYNENPIIVRINDQAYARFSDAYRLGVLKYIHSVKTIGDALKNHSVDDVLRMLSVCSTIFHFWDTIGVSVADNPVQTIDLSEGKSRSSALKMLQKEMRIRTGKESGKKNPTLNKYFKKSGILNVRGIKLISE